MELLLQRDPSVDGATLGDLFIGEDWECRTLEDQVRDDGYKVLGATAIPQGRYQVVIDFSNRFQKRMPHLPNVPGFEGIRIHSGNTTLDTEGCILVGQSSDRTTISGSHLAFIKLFAKLDAETEPIWITIRNSDFESPASPEATP